MSRRPNARHYLPGLEHRTAPIGCLPARAGGFGSAARRCGQHRHHGHQAPFFDQQVLFAAGRPQYSSGLLIRPYPACHDVITEPARYSARPLAQLLAQALLDLEASLPAATSGDAKSRTRADNQTVRNVFVIGPDKKIKLILVYPMTTGRNFDEVLRVIDSLQLTARHKVSTPVNWRQGEDVIIAGSVSDDEARKTYPQGWKAPRPYIRIVPQPQEPVGS